MKNFKQNLKFTRKKKNFWEDKGYSVNIFRSYKEACIFIHGLAQSLGGYYNLEDLTYEPLEPPNEYFSHVKGFIE